MWSFWKERFASLWSCVRSKGTQSDMLWVLLRKMNFGKIWWNLDENSYGFAHLSTFGIFSQIMGTVRERCIFQGREVKSVQSLCFWRQLAIASICFEIYESIWKCINLSGNLWVYRDSFRLVMCVHQNSLWEARVSKLRGVRDVI